MPAIGATVTAGGSFATRQAASADAVIRKHDFKLKYAPHFGMFENHAGRDPVDQLKFMADVGFAALEDNGMKGRPRELQEKIAREMARLNMTMGVFVAHADFGQPTFASGKKDHQKRVLSDIRASVEVAKRVNARWCTVVPGTYLSYAGGRDTEWDYQAANVIELLRRCAEICEPAGLTMVLEPLNPWANHPGLFLTKIPQAYMICKAVKSPACKILDDLYHQQISEGNLIPNIDMAWSEIAYFQVGDNPGRKEPTTGEINYKNVFRHIHGQGFKGVVGMEHGKSKGGKEGEVALINAYAECDSFA
jgi:hydroxypyruvate isomerase